jgi:hypothetical protein
MSATVKRTQDELLAELTLRFGPDHANWAFICPACNDVASAADFRAALDSQGLTEETASQHLGQVCIGRLTGAPSPGTKTTERGCNWAAFGLFRGPEFIIMPDGHEAPCFAIAPATLTTTEES